MNIFTMKGEATEAKYGYLTEKEPFLGKDYQKTRLTTNHATLCGHVFLNGFRYKVFGWHRVLESGALSISLQAYIARKRRKSKSEKPEDNRGLMTEVLTDGDASVEATMKNPVHMEGYLYLNNIRNKIYGDLVITRENNLYVKNLRVYPWKDNPVVPEEFV